MFESSTTPKYEKCRKYPMNMHEKCMKSWNKMQKEGQKGFTGLGRQKPCKNFGRKRQKIFGGALAKSKREERSKNFLKKYLWKRQSDFLKNMFHEFRSIEKQPRSIEIDRDSNKTFWKDFDRLKQTEALSNIFKKKFDWSKNRMNRSKWAETR